MLKLNKGFSKTLTLGVIALGVQTVTTLSALAGPALFYRYSAVNLNQRECLTRAVFALRSEGLDVREPDVRINNTPFVFADNETYSAIIDCSQFATGFRDSRRVTVMVSGFEGDSNRLSSDLIDRML
ncbi:MAG: hypothetical protein HC934_03190 [Acaryochloridaceae cyanobacterium SU_2_1]|nr:hypothetical protein [Acaryochloridaceae cyanobacterium SU_2_1]